MAATADNESTLTLILDTAIQTGKLEERVNLAYTQGFSYISLPLVDPNHDNEKLTECKHNEALLENIPFVNYGQSIDIDSQMFSCMFGKLSQWITFAQSKSRWIANSSANSNNNNNNTSNDIIQTNNQSKNDDDNNENESKNDVITNNENKTESQNIPKQREIQRQRQNKLTREKHFCQSANNAAFGSAQELLLEFEINMATHLGIYNLVLPPLGGENFCPVKYASAIISCLSNVQYVMGIIPVLGTPQGWKNWQYLSKLLIFDIQCIIQPAIILTSDKPSIELQNEWFSFGVCYFYVNCDIFMTNSKSYPVLPRFYQSLLRRHMRVLNTTIILTQEEDIEDDNDMLHYSEYIQHLRTTVVKLSENETFSKSYWDMLQTPLQPLCNNLDYTTYETFERDSIKYIKYQEAITAALQDLIKLNEFSTTTTTTTNNTKADQNGNANGNSNGNGTISGIQTEEITVKQRRPIVIFVLGAGRGPLVDASINASVNTDIDIKVFAIEKNPYATVILKNKEKQIWNIPKSEPIVQVVSKDMRSWKPEIKADIIVSELLGSFGDNELSPECLNDVFDTLINRKHGINIPQSYTSYIAPISYYHVWRRLKTVPTDFETPHVVNLVNHRVLHDNQPCWKFEHFVDSNNNNKTKENSHNARYAEIEFDMKCDSVCHGFAGYFETVLYKDVLLSTRPENHTNDMYSWFPMYFPLKVKFFCFGDSCFDYPCTKCFICFVVCCCSHRCFQTPIFVRNGAKLVTHFWRKVSKDGVWYEWCVTEPVVSELHNPCHRSCIVKLH